MARSNYLGAFLWFSILTTGSLPLMAEEDKKPEDKDRERINYFTEKNVTLILAHQNNKDTACKMAVDRLQKLSDQFRSVAKDVEDAKDEQTRKKTEEAARAIASEVATARTRLLALRMKFFLENVKDDKPIFDPWIFIPRGNTWYEFKDRTPEDQFAGAIIQTRALMQASDPKYKDALTRQEALKNQVIRLNETLKLVESAEAKKSIEGSIRAAEDEQKKVKADIIDRQDAYYRGPASRLESKGVFAKETDKLLEKYGPKKDK